MTISTEEQLEDLRRAGRIVAEVLDETEAAVEPGITTREIDRVAGAALARRDAVHAPAIDYGFPGEICISVNDEAVHGVPSDRRVERGDLVKLDLVAKHAGYYADAARSVIVPPERPEVVALRDAARRAFAAGLRSIRPGATLRRIGRAIEQRAARDGFRTLPELTGHGVGAAIHEPPTVPNVADPAATGRLHEGLVIAMEPLLTRGSGEILPEDDDGWTIRTRDGAWVAHHEHSLVVTRRGPIVLTRLAA